MKHSKAILASILALSGCLSEQAPPGDDEVGETTRASLGGVADSTDFPNVCVVHVALPDDDEGNPQDPIACSCTLVEAQTVLTSARCVNENVEKDMVDGIEIRFGTGFGDGDPFAIDGGAAGITIHRYFDPDAANLNELALIRLTDAPTATPATLIDGSLADAVGEDLTLVGFGNRVDDGDIDDVRNVITTPITTVGERHVFAGTDDLTTCAGDSGGPGFLDGATDPVMAVMTARQGGCTKAVQRTRLDLYTESFLFPFIDRYSGACVLDGDCVTAGCRSPDPDCDPCLWQGGGAADCTEDCPTRDWDCELGSFVGEACGRDGDCEEGGRCVAAADDESFTYCSRPCGGDQAACPNGMECSDGECTYLTPSPGSPGATCSGAEACRSGVCECGVCQVQAGAGACTQGGGGFCAVGGGGGDGPAGALAPLALLALGLPIAIRRRRRRRR
jgi:MYXO-CTERM domain-containing protein